MASVIGTKFNHMFRLCVPKRFLSSVPDYTTTNLRINRGDYNVLNSTHIFKFKEILGEERVLTKNTDLERYNIDWFYKLRGNSMIVLKPKTTKEVSQILELCNKHRLAVCPQGGNTSVVGGSVPVFDEIIVSTELMNNIISLDETSGILVCEAGCILENITNFVNKTDLLIPLDLGSKGSCHIGGNISTNAGGLRILRFGNLHRNVLGIEAVQANGEILDCLSTLKKDNTGYHLKDLFIGSEGTLGFITKVAIQCPPQPQSVCLALLGLQNFDKVLKTFKQAQSDLSEILSAVEVMDAESMQIVNDHLHIKSPLDDYPFYLILETMGSNEKHDLNKLHTFLESALLKHYVLNGTATTEPSKVKAIWSIRDRIPETFKDDGYVFCYDFTLPLLNYYTLVSEMRKYMGSKSHRVFGFGHLGDGNLHLQISVKEFTKSIKEYIEPYLFKRVKELHGSISAEHGIGLLKSEYLDLVKSKACIDIMKNLKNILDPNGILNPYKVLRATY